MSPKYKYTPTEEQEQVIEAVRGKDSCMIQAYAGCAKTSTLEMAAQWVKVPALSIQFNKKTATEAKDKFPGNFSVMTLNALGHRAWAKAIGGLRVELDDRKLGKLVTQTIRDRKISLDSDSWDLTRQLVQQAMQRGLVPSGSGAEGFIPDNKDNWSQIASDLFIPDDSKELLCELAREVLVQNIALARQGKISFDDQIYCATMFGGQFPKFPVVFVDEAQDLSPLNHHMLTLCTREDGKLVAVGDERQAIYGFRGADGQSMEKIRKLRSSWQSCLLGTTFRCPKRVVERQQDHAPGFRAWHTNADGAIARLGQMTTEQDDEALWGWPELQALRPNPKAQVAILCRNNGPLLSMAFRLIRQGIAPYMLGRDIGKGLIALSKTIAKDDELPADLVRGRIDEWEQSESSKALANGDDGKVAGITDRAECLRAVIDSAGVRDAGQLRQALAKLFAKEFGDVTLSSIHRAKGLEWDFVLHLDPWRIPSRFARKAAKAGNTVPLEQEYNLRYVAETRTKHSLVLADLERFQ